MKNEGSIQRDELDENAFISAQAYDRMIPWENRLKREIPLIVEFFNPGTVLDIACSSGRHSFELEKYGFRSLGLDISESMIYIAQDLKAQNSAKSEFLALDVTQPIIDQIFENQMETVYDNALLLGNAIANMGNFEGGKQTIYNIYLMLKPGGKFICQTVFRPRYPHYLPLRKLDDDFVIQRIMVPVDDATVEHNVDLHVNKINLKTGEYESRKADNHFFMYTREEFETMVCSQGFRLVQLFGGYLKETPRAEDGATLVWVFEKPEIPIYDSSRVLFANYWKLTKADFPDLQQVELDERIVSNATKVWQEALSINNYRCIGSFRFLYPRIISHPLYAQITADLGDKIILDIGCHMGTDLRQLAVDGAKIENLIGTDLTSRFWELGMELFEEEGIKNIKFIAGDIVGDDLLDFHHHAGKLADYTAYFDIIHAGSLFHLLSKADTTTVIRKIWVLLKPDGILFGRMVGSGEEVDLGAPGGLRHLHSQQSLQQEFENLGFRDIEVTIMDEQGPVGERSQSQHQSLMFFARK